MIRSVYIIGYEGNMAKRYRACLDYLGVKHCGEDIYTDPVDKVEDCDGIIIATPTERHISHLSMFADYDKPILVEKPISLKPFILNGGNVQMVNQYAHCGPFPGGETYYDCWRTGNDGLAWDCINIIGLSDKMPNLNNKSPIWKCMINGKELTLADIDLSYIKMIDSWTKNPVSNTDYINEAHDKVRRFLEANNNRNPGEVYKYTLAW